MEFDPSQAWYHGSPRVLTALQVGSTITQKRELARIFSHKPSLVSAENDGRLRHNGRQPGYLYRVEGVRPGDVIPHPQTSMQPGEEWLTTRELLLVLLEPTTVVAEELLTEEELSALMGRMGN